MRKQEMAAEFKVHIVELNEFNLPFMRRVAEGFRLPHLLCVLSYRHGVTHADQEIEHQGTRSLGPVGLSSYRNPLAGPWRDSTRRRPSLKQEPDLQAPRRTRRVHGCLGTS